MQTIKQDLPILLESPTSSSAQIEWHDINIAVENLSAGVNPALLVLGLPDNRRQYPRWGFMLKGRIRVQYTDYEEAITAGDLYYIPAESAIFIEEETEVIEFSPKGNYPTIFANIDNNHKTNS